MTSPKTQTGSTVADLTNDSPLADRIRATAHKLAYRYGAHADDVQSEITLAVLERYYEDPDFLTDNTIAYVVSHGAWYARDVLKRECVQVVNRTVDGDARVPQRGRNNSCQDRVFDLITADQAFERECEKEVERRLLVEDALNHLDRRDRRIAQLYAHGWTPRDMADELDTPWRTIYYRLNHPIKRAFEAAALAQSAA